jgi:hypothetical protein
MYKARSMLQDIPPSLSLSVRKIYFSKSLAINNMKFPGVGTP